ncbi:MULTISPECIES: tyrosine-type recombinase/integrase [unclassified Mesorhizobium]|uniref:tyrosine-type recombinase/integrase n=1 Tax=unclassified Mesorhizobium TaxID=325217 RepID=UPI00142F22D7|nr:MULTISPECIES: tyrosine-type recombinase/integrase [unclassified Mesorhizobium]
MPVLSDDFLKRLSLGDKPERIFRDSRLPGFCLRVRRNADASLSKLFFVMHELPGKEGKRRRRKVSIGEASKFPAAMARSEAEAMLRAIKNGDDPAAAKAAKKAQPLFEDVAADFETHYLADRKPATIKDYRGRIRRLLTPYFKGRRFADITPDMVSAFMRKHKAHPTDANRALAVLSKMMNWQGRRADNPCMRLPKFKEIPREAWLDEIDLPKFVKALAAIKTPIGDLLRFMTVSGWRISEARLMTFDMVDLQRMIVRLPDSKTGAQTRALSTDAATIIDRQQHRIGFVFSNRKGRYPVGDADIREVLDGVCAVAGVERITPHALRHTAATWAALSGAQAHELREAFGWKTLAMTARYVARAESLGRRGAQRAADAMNVLQRPAADVKTIGAGDG